MQGKNSKTYLITGAAGFIGARFVESCQSRGISVISVDQKDYFKSRLENRDLDYGTILDRSDLFEWLSQLTPSFDAIVHLGAITDTRETNLQRLDQLNFEYSKSLWNYASKLRIPMIYASSAATYGDGAQGYDDREELIPQLHPLNAYGDSKQRFDLWALEQEKVGNHPPSWAGFKFFNVYGFGERHKGFMSSVVLHAFDEIQKTSQVSLFKSHRQGIADGHQKRDFISVEDVVKVIHFALEKPIRRGIFNLGTGTARTFLDLARAVFRALNLPEKVEFKETPMSIRDKYQYFTEAKMDRLKAEGYPHPFMQIEEGVRNYVNRLLASRTES